MSHIETIKKQAIQIVEIPQGPTQGNGLYLPANDLNGLYDARGGSPLGIVKRNFNVVQPLAVIEEVERCLGELNGIDSEKLEYHVMRDGARHRLSVQVKEFGFKNQRKMNDITSISLTVQWGYDGWTPFEMNLFPRRLVCLNGMTAPMKGTKVRFKNYSDNGDRLNFACEQFAKVIASTEDYMKFAKSLDKLVVDDVDTVAAISKVMGTDPKATAQIWNKGQAEKGLISDPKQATLVELIESVRHEFKQTGVSAWGLLNGFTHFTNHKEPFRTANTQSVITDRTEYLTYGGGAKINADANKVVAELFES